jgi:hypothetical protein
MEIIGADRRVSDLKEIAELSITKVIAASTGRLVCKFGRDVDNR